jgi:hypothetical protein
MGHRGVGLLLVVWALIYSREGYGGNLVDEFASESTCLRVRAANVDHEIQNEIGSALASQPADNPMRQQAFDRASRRVAARYRCTSSRD